MLFYYETVNLQNHKKNYVQLKLQTDLHSLHFFVTWLRDYAPEGTYSPCYDKLTLKPLEQEFIFSQNEV